MSEERQRSVAAQTDAETWPTGSLKITESIICAIIVQFVIHICAVNKLLLFFPSCKTVAKQMVKVMEMFPLREPMGIICGIQGPQKKKNSVIDISVFYNLI